MEKSKFKTSYTAKEVNELLKTYSPKRRYDLNVPDLGLSYYEFTDGRILVVIGETNSPGTMYRSETEFKNLTEIKPKGKKVEHVLSNLIPNDQVFLASINLYIDTLAFNLKISPEKLDRSLQSVKLIDSAYAKKRPSQSVFFKRDYLHLIAYLGEVYRKEKEGDWFFKKYPGEESYQPYIKTNGNKLLNPFLDLFKECFEDYKSFSIYSVADFAVSEIRLGASKR